MNQKDQLLKTALDEIIFHEDTLDGEPGGRNEDEVTLWTVGRWTNGSIIWLHYFTWHDDIKEWIVKSISEIEGPALLNCPVRFFSRQDIDFSLQFPEWRYEVKKFHESIGPEVQEKNFTN